MKSRFNPSGILLVVLSLSLWQPAEAQAGNAGYRHIRWYYLNQPSTDNQRDWYEQADGGWVEQYVNGDSSSFSLIAQNVSLDVVNSSNQHVTVIGRVIEKSDQSLIAFIPDQIAAGMWLQFKVPGSFAGQWSYLAPIQSVDGTIALSGAPAPAPQPAYVPPPTQQAPTNPAAGVTVNAYATSGTYGSGWYESSVWVQYQNNNNYTVRVASVTSFNCDTKLINLPPDYETLYPNSSAKQWLDTCFAVPTNKPPSNGQSTNIRVRLLSVTAQQ
jgi:hypothetical protein